MMQGGFPNIDRAKSHSRASECRNITKKQIGLIKALKVGLGNVTDEH
jgi:hypothetical protein